MKIKPILMGENWMLCKTATIAWATSTVETEFLLILPLNTIGVLSTDNITYRVYLKFICRKL